MLRRPDMPRQPATAFDDPPVGSGSSEASSCVVLVLGASTLTAALLEEVTLHRRLDRGAVIVWHAETNSELVRDELGAGAVPAGFIELADGATLEPGGRYHVSAHRRVWFEGRRARVAARALNDHRPIDRLLLTLAESWGNRSVSVLGLPLDDDGECGLRIVHAVGGLALHRPALASPREAGLAPDPDRRAAVQPPPAAAAHGVPGLGDPALPLKCAFPAHWLASAREACDAAIQRGAPRGRVRAWVPACKTGALTHAVAMLLMDAARRAPLTPPKVLVFGTDDHGEDLAVARTGRYPAGAVLGMDSDLRGRYLFDEGDTVRVSEALREVCVFSRHELSRDVPMARMDLIVCQGIFDGLAVAQHAELVDAFHYSLRDGGLLLALDHLDVFPEDRFERIGGAYLRARPWRRRRSAPPPGNPGELADATASSVIGLEPARAPRLAEAFVSTVGLPLIVCDRRLSAFFLSPEAHRIFGLSSADLGASLEALAHRLPGGLDLLSAAQSVLKGEPVQSLTVRGGQRTYLARVASAERAGEPAVVIALSDVTQFESSSARAVAQRQQEAAVVRFSQLALTLTEPQRLYEEALGVLLGNIPDCSSGVIVELAGNTRELEVVASRGLGVDPLRKLQTLGDAAALLDAVVDAGCIVSQGGERVRSDPSASLSRAELPRVNASRPMLASVTRGVGCPISAEGKVLGVVALYGRRAGVDDTDHQSFIQAVATLLGGALVRQRARRQLALELEVSRLLASASDLGALGAGLPQALATALPVDVAEVWSAPDAARERWTRLVPSPDGANPAPPWPASLPGHSGVIYGTVAAEHGELLVPIERQGAPFGMLWLRGKGLRLPDAALSEGLQRIGRMLAEFFERLRVLDLARRSEAMHRQKSAELEALYVSLPVGVSIHDRQGLIRHVNRHLAPLESASHTPGAGPLERLYAEEIPTWVASVLESGEPIHDVELTVSVAATPHCFLCNFAPIRDADGRVHGASAVVQDITPLKQVEVTLREADQQKDDFLAMLGHELRNPMAAIRNATELLSRIERPSPQLLRLQSIFDRQTLQTTKLIDGLLDVARVARGKVSLQLGPVQVVELVRQAVDDRRQQFQGRVLDLRLSDDDIWAVADRVRLVQIVDNLISNALKFTPASGTIRIEVSRSLGTGSIRVEDDGMGIDAELLPQIFEAFRQGHPMKSQSQGLGLGLALVKGLVDLHGFQLRAHSDGVDQGASFQIDFPVAAAPEQPAPESRVDLRGLDLLLVEDNSDVAETLVELLVSAGHRVEHQASAEGALDLLRCWRPDVVLCDIGLPGMDGLALAAHLRADPELCDLKLVAMTGFGDASTQSRIEHAGFDRQLIKPVQLEALRHCLSRVAAQTPVRLSRR